MVPVILSTSSTARSPVNSSARTLVCGRLWLEGEECHKLHLFRGFEPEIPAPYTIVACRRQAGRTDRRSVAHSGGPKRHFMLAHFASIDALRRPPNTLKTAVLRHRESVGGQSLDL